MEDVIELLQKEIEGRCRTADRLVKEAKDLREQAREIENAIAVLKKVKKAESDVFEVDYNKPLMPRLQEALANGEPGVFASGEELKEVFDGPTASAEPETPAEPPPRPQETAPKFVSQKPHHETQKELRDRLVQEGTIKPASQQSIDLRKGKWSEEKKEQSRRVAQANSAKKRTVVNGRCPLAIKGNNLFNEGLYIDDLDQDEKFIMVDLIRDFGFEVLRSMMRGTIKDVDKVVGKLRTVIPRSLEIIDTATGWKMQAKEG